MLTHKTKENRTTKKRSCFCLLADRSAGAGVLSAISSLMKEDITCETPRPLPFFNFSLCLSRPCLGKLIGFWYKIARKRCVFRTARRLRKLSTRPIYARDKT